MPSITLQFLGVSCAKITTEQGVKILIDPYIEGNPNCPVGIDEVLDSDIILVTHGATDHFGNTLDILKRNQATVICDPAVGIYLREQGIPPDRVRGKCWGDTVHLHGLKVKVVYTAHISIMMTPNKMFAGIPVGFILETEAGIRLYNPGDTSLFGDMKLFGKLYQPHIGLIPVSYPPGDPEAIHLSPYEAAIATDWLNLSQVIPVHYISGVRNPEVFQHYIAQTGLKCSVLLLTPGEERLLEFETSELIPSDEYLNIIDPNQQY
ncbi:metal-dependent hydrolase [candidate division KSB3 bacterium]|uniref:Metal-dependent hydrolase n=1 Tax=candidate division KSB3 bacterium TaxID=2044937 RepID=A0A9D5JYJ5_9BACT|nr:metal-dependent hydrolase [candidate division KSB3 bacterium]MBD3326493.1 metal-dependent hydrolase [candidate division KSB3 bacterium]